MNMTQAKHAFVPTTCDTCHEAGLSFYMGSASPALQGRPADHTSGQMVAPNDCSLCHTTANWNTTVLPAGHMPNPGNQACTVCHTAAPSNYATLATNSVLHTGITSGCITCHGPPTGALTFYNNFTPKSAVLSPVHIPTGSTPCQDCHTATVFSAFSATTMTSAKHTSMFAYIGSTCDACHNKVTPALSFYGVTNLQTRPSDHSSGSKLNNDCSSCHNPNNWDGGAQRRPTTTIATTTKPTTTTVTATTPVTATTAAVGAIRIVRAGMSPVASAPGGFSHLGVSGNCVSCHNGSTATGKGPTHISSNDRCENCHTTIAWLPARFDHRGVTASCLSCHNGVVTTGKAISHIPTSLDCSSCHGTIAWRPARFSHVGLAGTCQSCHNALSGFGKSLGHVPTTLDCGSCHTTVSWYPARAPTPAMPRAPAPAAQRPLSGLTR
jgi:hypothetical protein